MRAPNMPTSPTAITSLEHEFRTRNGYSIEAEVGRVLMGLGFRKEDWERQTDEFSRGLANAVGAGQTAAAEAQSSFCWTSQPTILTWKRANWLEEYLHDYPHAFCAHLARPLFPSTSR